MHSGVKVGQFLLTNHPQSYSPLPITPESPPRYILVESRDSCQSAPQYSHCASQTIPSNQELLRLQLEEIRTLVSSDRTLCQNYQNIKLQNALRCQLDRIRADYNISELMLSAARMDVKIQNKQKYQARLVEMGSTLEQVLAELSIYKAAAEHLDFNKKSAVLQKEIWFWRKRCQVIVHTFTLILSGFKSQMKSLSKQVVKQGNVQRELRQKLLGRVEQVGAIQKKKEKGRRGLTVRDNQKQNSMTNNKSTIDKR